MSEANKDEAQRCLSIAKQALQDGDVSKAEKFGHKALRLYRTEAAEAFLVMVQARKSCQDNTPNGTSQPDQASGSSTSRQQQQPEGFRQRFPLNSKPAPKAAKQETKEEEPEPDSVTDDQRQLVQSIIKAKDFYDILGVAKSASDDDIKKAYRKLALKLHPDKCKARGAEDAFKAVSRAFSCLSDSQKRAHYDRTGYESAGAAQQARAQQQASAGHMYYGYDDGFDPDEIFRMFFGGAAFGPHTRVFRHHFGPGGHHQQQQQQRATPAEQQRNLIMSFVQFLPILLLVMASFFNRPGEPAFSYTRDGKYPHQLETFRLSVPYYVRSLAEHDKQYPPGSRARNQLELEVETTYYEHVQSRCHQERLIAQRQRVWGGRSKEPAATPNCEQLIRLNEKLGQHRHRQTPGYAY